MLSEEEGGKLRKTYQYGPDGELLSQAKFKDDGSFEDSYQGYNPHTDVEQITDEQGDSRATYGYTAYGKNDDSPVHRRGQAGRGQPGGPEQGAVQRVPLQRQALRPVVRRLRHGLP